MDFVVKFYATKIGITVESCLGEISPVTKNRSRKACFFTKPRGSKDCFFSKDHIRESCIAKEIATVEKCSVLEKRKIEVCPTVKSCGVKPCSLVKVHVYKFRSLGEFRFIENYPFDECGPVEPRCAVEVGITELCNIHHYDFGEIEIPEENCACAF